MSKTAGSDQQAKALKLKAQIEGLLAAVQSGSKRKFKDAVKVLEDNTPKAIREIRDQYGRSCLHHAAQMGHFDLCKHLIDEIKFNVNDQDSKGVSLLTMKTAWLEHIVHALHCMLIMGLASALSAWHGHGVKNPSTRYNMDTFRKHAIFCIRWFHAHSLSCYVDLDIKLSACTISWEPSQHPIGLAHTPSSGCVACPCLLKHVQLCDSM